METKNRIKGRENEVSNKEMARGRKQRKEKSPAIILERMYTAAVGVFVCNFDPLTEKIYSNKI